MEKLATEALYSQLFKEFCRFHRPQLAARRILLKELKLLGLSKRTSSLILIHSSKQTIILLSVDL